MNIDGVLMLRPISSPPLLLPPTTLQRGSKLKSVWRVVRGQGQDNKRGEYERSYLYSSFKGDGWFRSNLILNGRMYKEKYSSVKHTQLHSHLSFPRPPTYV
jgi:hypothetical protein